MAALVQFLAAGVNGAASGSATFVLRGTASSAASVLWNDFEETAQPGTNIITLDSNGAAEVYCSAYCDVTLKTSAGSTIRTVTIGNAATTVEVISDSFTGTDYSGSPTATGEPITLAAILDKWDNSAGADDWKVSVAGSAVNLSTAFASLAGLFFNVKDPAYGALGDGVTDDTTAIGLAISAANTAGGGIVFFPASTNAYIFTTLSISSANITLMGTGPKSSRLQSASTSADLITFTDNTSGAWKRIIDLGIAGSGASANEVLSFENSQNILLKNLDITATSFTGALLSRDNSAGLTFIEMLNCVINLGSANANGLSNGAVTGRTAWNVNHCKFVIPASFTGNAILGADFTVTGCTFDGSAVTSGIYRHVNAVDGGVPGKYVGRYVGNTFIDGGSTGFAFQLVSIVSASDFTESDNTFVGFTAPTALTGVGQIYNVSHNAGDGYKVYLGSRKGRVLEVSNSSTGTMTPSAITSYESLFITHTGAGNVTFQLPISTMTSGAEFTIVLLNSSGAQRDIVLDVGESVSTYSNQSGTSGTDITTQPQDTERSIFRGVYTHNGSGAPIAIVVTGLED